jgi:hypothetical protein
MSGNDDNNYNWKKRIIDWVRTTIVNAVSAAAATLILPFLLAGGAASVQALVAVFKFLNSSPAIPGVVG